MTGEATRENRSETRNIPVLPFFCHGRSRVYSYSAADSSADYAVHGPRHRISPSRVVRLHFPNIAYNLQRRAMFAVETPMRLIWVLFREGGVELTYSSRSFNFLHQRHGLIASGQNIQPTPKLP